MDISTDYQTASDAIATLFTTTFTASEGPEEGALIGGLARRLIAETPAADLRVFIAWKDGVPVGCIFFSRLTFECDLRTVFILAPVAVATGWQGQGIGQRLIAHALDALRREGVDIAVTYGDPAFYSRVQFKPIRQADVPAPFALQHPEGWLGQSLTSSEIAVLKGPACCVKAFNDPVFW